MQGMVNNVGHFTEVYIRFTLGRQYRVFVNSTLYTKGQNSTLIPDWKHVVKTFLY